MRLVPMWHQFRGLNAMFKAGIFGRHRAVSVDMDLNFIYVVVLYFLYTTVPNMAG